MTNEVHPLQEQSVKLLTALYADRRLPATPAIVNVTNYRYPSIKQILSTLELYKGEELVVAFVQENDALISDAINQVAAHDLSKEEQNEAGQNRSPEDISSIFGSKFEIVSAYDCLKAISFKEIEDALSRELSMLCKEHLLVEIESTQVDHKNAELKIRIKPKEYISTWNDADQVGAGNQNESGINQA